MSPTKKNTSSSDNTLTNRQRELLEFIQATVGQESRMPSYREMAQALKVSAVGTIQDHIKVLVDKGYVEKEKHKGKVILKLAGARQASFVNVPLVGEVAAGTLRDAFEVAMGSVPFASNFLKGSQSPDDYFALRVSGESMIEAGILPGDIVVVNRKSRTKSGDMAVVEYEGDVTLKELKINKHSIVLIPKNSSMDPIPISNPENLRILGKVVGVQRVI